MTLKLYEELVQFLNQQDYCQVWLGISQDPTQPIFQLKLIKGDIKEPSTLEYFNIPLEAKS